MQTTLANPITIKGLGLHTGKPVVLTLRPAPAGHGIVFCRTDLGDTTVKALWSNVVQSPLNTRLRAENGAEVSTIEHLMAALSGLGIHNVVCALNGPEVPILDGSAAPFVRALLRAGVTDLNAPLYAIEVLREVSYCHNGACASISPARGVTMSFGIDFEDAAIGVQSRSIDLANGAFVREICDSRTFCRSEDVDIMRDKGFALGGTLENAVVVAGTEILTPGGFRHDDEAVRHKMLDAVGDLYTAGAPVLGHYVGRRAGHAITNGLLRKLMSDEHAWRLRRVDARLRQLLPGTHVSADDLELVA